MGMTLLFDREDMRRILLDDLQEIRRGFSKYLLSKDTVGVLDTMTEFWQANTDAANKALDDVLARMHAKMRAAAGQPAGAPTPPASPPTPPAPPAPPGPVPPSPS